MLASRSGSDTHTTPSAFEAVFPLPSTTFEWGQNLQLVSALPYGTFPSTVQPTAFLLKQHPRPKIGVMTHIKQVTEKVRWAVLRANCPPGFPSYVHCSNLGKRHGSIRLEKLSQGMDHWLIASQKDK